MDAGLKWFTRIWVVLLLLFNLFGIIGYAVTASSIWDTVNWLQQTYSPFNIWTHGLNILLFSPALIAYLWRQKKEKGRTLSSFNSLTREMIMLLEENNAKNI
jgi:hypothetical protein